MLLIFAIVVALAVAVSVFAVEYADRQKHQQLRNDAEYWREQIKLAQQQHRARRHLYRELVEAKRRELMQ